MVKRKAETTHDLVENILRTANIITSSSAVVSTPIKTKIKADVDPNRPKRPPTAYILFFKATRQHVRDEYPDIKETEVAKMCGLRWNALLPDDKKIYEMEHFKAKELYEQAMRMYTPSLQYTDGSKSKKFKGSSSSKQNNDPNRPKRPLSSYMQFFKDIRLTVKSAHPELTEPEIATECGKLWKALDTDKKDQYTADAKIAREKHDQKVFLYESAKMINILDESDDDIPNKLKHPPTSKDLKKFINQILKTENLDEITMKVILNRIYESFPKFKDQLVARKLEIKYLIRDILSTM